MGTTLSAGATLTTIHVQSNISWDSFFLGEFQSLAFATSNNSLVASDSYRSFLARTRFISSCLSIPCIFYNVLLITFLLSCKDFRNWQFYPMMLQAGIDSLGPGVANIIYNIELAKHVCFLFENFFMAYNIPIFALPSIGRYDGSNACILTYFRELLNEVSTGLCVCATGLYRYLMVCHPTSIREASFYKTGALVVTTVIILQLILLSADFAFNSTYSTIVLQFEQQRFRMFTLLKHFCHFQIFPKQSEKRFLENALYFKARVSSSVNFHFSTFTVGAFIITITKASFFIACSTKNKNDFGKDEW